jgi:hypothetical protein
MKRGVSIFSVLLGLVGIVWVLQGIGILGGSIMTNDIKWAVIGAVLIVVAGGLTYWVNRQSAGNPPAA